MARNASAWKFDDFLNLGIKYNEKPDDIKYFSDILEKRIPKNRNLKRLLYLRETFAAYTNDFWKCSIDLSDGGVYEIEDGIISTFSSLGDMEVELCQLKSIYDEDAREFFLPDGIWDEEHLLEVSTRYHELCVA